MAPSLSSEDQQKDLRTSAVHLSNYIDVQGSGTERLSGAFVDQLNTWIDTNNIRQSVESDESTDRKGRSSSKSLVNYPPEWVTDRSAVKKVLQNLEPVLGLSAYPPPIASKDTMSAQDWPASFASGESSRSKGPAKRPDMSGQEWQQSFLSDDLNKGKGVERAPADRQSAERTPGHPPVQTPQFPDFEAMLSRMTASLMKDLRQELKNELDARLDISEMISRSREATGRHPEDRPRTADRSSVPAPIPPAERQLSEPQFSQRSYASDNNHVKANEIGFFYPNMPRDWGRGDTVDKEGKTYYRDVFAFTNRIRAAVVTRDPERVKLNLDACLRGEAELWWNSTLSTVYRRGLIASPGVNDYCDALEERFQPPPSEALARFENTKYTVQDCRNKRSVTEYVAMIESAAKACGQGPRLGDETKFGIVLQCWRHLDPVLRRSVDEPLRDTSLKDFTNTLLRKQANWFDEHAYIPNRQQQQPRQQYRDQHGNVQNRNYAPMGQDGKSASFTPFRQGNSQYANTGRGGFQQRQPVQTNNPQNQYRPNGGQRPNQYQNNKPGGNQNSGYQNPSGSGGQYGQKQQNGPQNAGQQQGGKRPPVPNGNGNRQYPQQNRQQNGYGYANHMGVQQGQEPNTGESYDFNDPGYQYDEPDAYGYDNAQSYVADGNEYPPESQDDGCQDYDNGQDGDPSLKENDPQDDRRAFGFFSQSLSTPTAYECKHCKEAFNSKNKLFKHIRSAHNVTKRAQDSGATMQVSFAGIPLREKISTAPPLDNGTGLGYRGYVHCLAPVRLSTTVETESVCFDSGCSATTMSREFFQRQCPNIPIRTMARPMALTGIGSDHSSSEYAIVDIRVAGTDAQGPVEAVLRHEVHIIDKMKVNMLVGTDVMVPEKIDLLFSKNEMHIGSCGTTVPVQVRHKAPQGQNFRPVHIKSSTVIPPRGMVTVPIHAIPQGDRDFLFEPDDVDVVTLYSTIVDDSTSTMLVKNTSDKPVQLQRNMRIGRLYEMEDEHGLTATAFAGSSIEPEDIVAMSEKPPRQMSPYWFVKALSALHNTEAELPVVPKDNENLLPNGVTVYGEQPALNKLSRIVAEFPKLWEDSGAFVDIPEDEWMKIPLRSDWESRAPSKHARVYPQGIEARKLIDATFDELHDKGRLSWTTKGTPFSFPVFVVWKTLPSGERKGRVVVDIRGLNQITQADVYPIPLQADIIAAVSGCPYITVMDCASFFYQWRVAPEDRHKLTVVTHRGQESFNVVVMGFKNSVSYVQRQIDRILRPYADHARAYIDDVVIFSKSLQDHVRHLREIFALFVRLGITIKPSKTFLGFPTVQLLGQHIDSLGLATSEDKLKAIAAIKFPTTLHALETYIGLTGWLRQYVPYYAAIVQPLERRKTGLLKDGPKAGTSRRNYSAATKIGDPSPLELAAFETLQEQLLRSQFLVHFAAERRLYIDVDASKAFGIGGIVYHCKNESEGYPRRNDIEPIMFLSRALSPAEKNYWPTELEMAGLVWILRKTRFMLESTKQTVRVYTDHSSALGIAKQRSLISTATDRTNLRLVRASEYVQRFDLDIRHKAGKTHLVPDALSRLASLMPPAESAELDFDTASGYNYTASLIEMSKEFRARLQEGYKEDPSLRRILAILNDNSKLVEQDRAVLPFVQEDGLVWHINEDYGRRLCIPESMTKEILDIGHTRAGHPGESRTFERVAGSCYKRNDTLLYGFSPNFQFDINQNIPAIEHPIARIEAADAVDFAKMMMKSQYDRRHTPAFMKVGEYAAIKLHHGYKLPAVKSKKLGQQYTRPFKIIEKIGRLAYRLAIPDNWAIHNVFSIAQLEPCPNPEDDPYERPYAKETGPVQVDGQEEWEVEKIVNVREVKKGRGKSRQYLVRFVGWGPEADEWLPAKHLSNCKELIDEYEDSIAAASQLNPAREDQDGRNCDQKGPK
ncbi:hypothetical protein PVAG01_01576 [Phlyctema vagabunda]|uniref:RNA-directed DNA polymerase n=1 Tax=Phlyctema vagabunda TaxID=108571 RepID=A0ABR4PXG7_9HELO